jgi:hypothetical protein
MSRLCSSYIHLSRMKLRTGRHSYEHFAGRNVEDCNPCLLQSFLIKSHNVVVYSTHQETGRSWSDLTDICSTNIVGPPGGYLEIYHTAVSSVCSTSRRVTAIGQRPLKISTPLQKFHPWCFSNKGTYLKQRWAILITWGLHIATLTQELAIIVIQ